MLDLIEPLRVTKNRSPDLLHGEGTCSWVVTVNCYIIHSVLEWAVCTTSINRWFIIVAKELYRHSVWVYQPGVLYSLKRIPSRDTGTRCGLTNQEYCTLRKRYSRLERARALSRRLT